LLDPLFRPGSCLAVAIMFAISVLFRSEIRRHGASALPYLTLYWIAGTFYAAFVAFALEDPAFSGKLGLTAGYLIFSTTVLIAGLGLHQQSAKARARRCAGNRPSGGVSADSSITSRNDQEGVQPWVPGA